MIKKQLTGKRMKYRKAEQKKVDYHNREIERYEKMIFKEQERFAKVNAKHIERLRVIRDYKSNEESKISTIDKQVKKRCKHIGDRYSWENCRDDRSFERYVGCVDCGEIMWKECK